MENLNPKHYGGDWSVGDFIVDYKLGFLLGNVVKYLVRADHKGQKQSDLNKAFHYMSRFDQLYMYDVNRELRLPKAKRNEKNRVRVKELALEFGLSYEVAQILYDIISMRKQRDITNVMDSIEKLVVENAIHQNGTL